MPRQSFARIVGMTDVETAVGAFEDVQGEFHFAGFLAVWSLACPSTSPRRGYAQGDRFRQSARPERRPEGPKSKGRPSPGLQNPALHLVPFDTLEQRLEISLAETFVALALDDLEEDRADAVLGEDLQQQALLRFLVGVDQDLVLRQPRHVLAVPGDALVDHLEIGVGGVEEL